MREYNIQSENLTPDTIVLHQNNHEIDELTCLVLPDDTGCQSLLRAHGFRCIGRRAVGDVTMIIFKWFRGLREGAEDMASFFDRRVEDYDCTMRAHSYYEPGLENVAAHIKATAEPISVLDLGCGTGAELKYVFRKAPNAQVVCYDLSSGMLEKLLQNLQNYRANIETICDSYLNKDFGTERFDYVIACSTLHHILKEEKEELYKAIKRAMKKTGLLLISDYVVSPEKEAQYRKNYLEMISNGALDRNVAYHIDLVLSYETELDLMSRAGLQLIHGQRSGEYSVEFVAGIG